MNLETNIEKIRDEFPLLKVCTFLDAANQCIPNIRWMKVAHEYFDYQMTGRHDVAGHPFLSARAQHSKIEAAKLINASVEEICNMYRPSTGLNIVKDIIPWKKGDNVVCDDLGYPSSGHTWLQLRKKGVEIRRIKNSEGKILLTGGSSIKENIAPDCTSYGDLDQAIDEHTRLVCINRTTWTSGFTFDVEAVCKLAHEKGALVVDDAFQSIGAIKVDVKKDNIDFLITGSYKWQCGPEGAGFFYVRKDLINKYEPSFWSYGNIARPGEMGGSFGDPTHDNITSYDFPLVQDARRFDQGICVGEVLWAWDATLQYLNELEPTNVEQRVKKLGGYCIDRLLDLGIKVNTPIDPEERHGLISYTLKNHDLNMKSYEALVRHRPIPINVSIRYQGGIGGIRICCHFFNTEEDIDKVIDVQKRILED